MMATIYVRYALYTRFVSLNFFCNDFLWWLVDGRQIVYEKALTFDSFLNRGSSSILFQIEPKTFFRAIVVDNSSFTALFRQMTK